MVGSFVYQTYAIDADALALPTSPLDELLRRGVIPVVNENDSVAISELRFGDNDTLSALVATLVGADHLFLATDVDALYTSKYAPAPWPLAHSQHAHSHAVPPPACRH